MSSKENVKTLKKWRSFDFGPEVKDSNKTNPLDKFHSFSQETPNPKQITKTRNGKKTFNFHNSLVPKTISELAIHSKKIQELEEWFNNSVINHQKSTVGPPILLISGPSGCGKYTTAKVISASLGVSISEWVNPVDYDEYMGENQVSRFVDFLVGSKYNSLVDNGGKSISVVKEFPNTFIKNPEQFFDVLEELLYRTNNATIFICTDNGTGNLNLLRTLFKDEILEKYKIRHIHFNPCASTLLKGALKRAQEVVKQNLQLFNQPSATTMDAIIATSMGDIRNAINQFYIACMDSGDLPTVIINSHQVGTKRKRKRQEVKLKCMERDENLGLFHGLGRVLNPKWKGEDFKRLTCDVGKLVDEFSTQPRNFISFLFQNYLKYFGDISDALNAVEILGIAERFLKNFGEKEELLTYAMWLAILGTMTFNKHRISRWNEIRGPVKITKKVNKDSESVGFDSSDIFYCNLIRNTNSNLNRNF